MRKNAIIGLGAVCFVVVFALMIFGAIAVQQVSTVDTPEKTQEIEFIETTPEFEIVSPKNIVP